MTRCAQIFPLVAATLVAGAMIVGHSTSASAQTTRVKPGSDDDFRAAHASVLEIAEGKRVAEASCARCHGVNGISTTKDVPHLAGQRPVYLHLELRAYQSGARGDKAMEGAAKFLSDDALVKVSAYYASLEPAQPATTRREGQRPPRSACGRQGRGGRLRGVSRR